MAKYKKQEMTKRIVQLISPEQKGKRIPTEVDNPWHHASRYAGDRNSFVTCLELPFTSDFFGIRSPSEDCVLFSEVPFCLTAVKKEFNLPVLVFSSSLHDSAKKVIRNANGVHSHHLSRYTLVPHTGSRKTGVGKKANIKSVTSAMIWTVVAQTITPDNTFAFLLMKKGINDPTTEAPNNVAATIGAFCSIPVKRSKLPVRLPA